MRVHLCFHGLKARLTTLDDSHITRTAWSQRSIDPRIRNIQPKTRPRHLPSDNPRERLATDLVREQFLPYHPLSQPGDRIADRFASLFSIDSYSPKKGSSLFKAWCSDLSKSISVLHSSDRPVIYTDGAFLNKTARGTFSFTCYHKGVWHDFYNWCPAGSSFDAEIAAIEQAIQWACTRNLINPVFFIDNKAALISFLDTRVRSSHMATIRINSILLDHFTSPNPTMFTFRYCPSHSGIEGNDRTD